MDHFSKCLILSLLAFALALFFLINSISGDDIDGWPWRCGDHRSTEVPQGHDQEA